MNYGILKSCQTLSALQDKILIKLTPEVLQEISSSRLTVPATINRPCELNTLSTIPDSWSDGMEHNCRSIKESVRYTFIIFLCKYPTSRQKTHNLFFVINPNDFNHAKGTAAGYV